MPRGTDSAAPYHSSVGAGSHKVIDSDEESLDSWLEGDLQPMSESHKTILRNHRDQLIELVNPVEVLIRLESSGVLSKHEMQEINKDKNTRHDKNEILLDHILIKADSAFDKFLYALAISNQIHISCLLSPGYHKTHSLTPKKKTPKARRSAKQSLNAVVSPVQSSPAKSTATVNSEDKGSESEGPSVQVRVGIDKITQEASRPSTRNSVKHKKELLENAIYDNLLLYRRKQQQLKRITTKKITEENANREKEIQESMNFLLEQNEKLQSQLDELGVFEMLEAHGRSVGEIDRGSILLSVHCPTLHSLDDLRRQCQGPDFINMFERAFITSDVLRKLALTDASLKINMERSDYLQCRKDIIGGRRAQFPMLGKCRNLPTAPSLDLENKQNREKTNKVHSVCVGDARPRAFGEITNLQVQGNSHTQIKLKPLAKSQHKLTKAPRPHPYRRNVRL